MLFDVLPLIGIYIEFRKWLMAKHGNGFDYFDVFRLVIVIDACVV